MMHLCPVLKMIWVLCLPDLQCYSIFPCLFLLILTAICFGLADEKEAKVLHDFSNCFNLMQVIDKPTRITQFSKSLIDVIVTNNANLIKETQVIPQSISDHGLIIATLQPKEIPHPKPASITTRGFKHYDKDAFLEDISNNPWSILDTLRMRRTNCILLIPCLLGVYSDFRWACAAENC